ncbi:MAG: 16S rRNA (uracil(1498)-N(3))-methyltransferase [Clostridia bacterium]|nr:16S rRNA (uracil(1498)-N(3))-methyltransferase [Clostridia bacterium]
MPRFFVEKSAVRDGETVLITGEDAKHISLSLRSKPGEAFVVCDEDGKEYNCVVSEITKNQVCMQVLSSCESKSEPDVSVTLYQALVKSDKFESVIQKSVELGVSKIVPVVTKRCVSRPDEASLNKKLERWRKIAKEAAMQSGRGKVPTVENVVSMQEALTLMKKDDCFFVCYEDLSHTPVSKVVNTRKEALRSISFLVGPEGGIDECEAQKCRDMNIPLAGLGPRILRTETAPLCVISVLMLLTGNLD